MKISEQRLREIIVEELLGKSEQKIEKLLSSSMKTAEIIVNSYIVNKRDKQKIQELEGYVKELKPLANWLMKRNEPNSQFVSRFTKLAEDLLKLTGFWSSPKFFKKEEHYEKLKTILEKMKEVRYQEATSSYRAEKRKSTPTVNTNKPKDHEEKKSSIPTKKGF